MKSWKTTLCGVIAAAAGGVAGANIDPAITKIAGIIAMIATAAIGVFASDHSKDPKTEDKKISPPGALLLTACACLLFLPACSSDRLAAGGSYAPATTNQVGEVSSQPDLAFFAADSAFDLAYATIDAAFQFEHDNRAWLFKLNPEIKHTLDRIRPTANEIAQKYSEARKLYVENPTPAGLTTLQLWLSRIQKVTAMATAVLPQETLATAK